MTRKFLTRRFDVSLACGFSVSALGFVVLAATSEDFFAWIWSRHHNLLSWYIRPLFLVPFAFFAYCRSWAGIAGTMFLLTTSMAWFPAPESAGLQVVQFLEMEKSYLYGTWNGTKVLMSLLVPVSLIALGTAFWRRNLSLGVYVLIAIAAGKLAWSIALGGESGKSILAPALIGLALCIGVVCAGIRELHRRREIQTSRHVDSKPG